MSGPPDASPPQDVYTHGHHDSVLRSHRWRTVENSAAYLTPYLVPGAALLDVGCGPGTLTADLAARVAPGPVTALDKPSDDQAAGVLDEARTTLASAGVAATVVAGDAYALDFPDAEPDAGFDVVHAHQVLQHLSNPVLALAEMRRVCRPGGVVAARDVDYRSMRWWPEDPRLTAWLNLYCAVAEANSAFPDAGRRLGAWAAEVGFRSLTLSASVWHFWTAEDRQWWGSMWADRVTTSSLASQAVSLGLAVTDDLHAMADAWREWAAHPDAQITMTHGELLAQP